MDKEMGNILDVAHRLSEVDRIIAYESGELNHDETVDLFQSLIDSGLVWRLQGHYGRMASHLIGAGFCHEKGATTNED